MRKRNEKILLKQLSAHFEKNYQAFITEAEKCKAKHKLYNGTMRYKKAAAYWQGSAVAYEHAAHIALNLGSASKSHKAGEK